MPKHAAPYGLAKDLPPCLSRFNGPGPSVRFPNRTLEFYMGEP